MTRFVTINPLQLNKLQIKLFCPREPTGDVLWEVEGPEVLLKQCDGGGGAFSQIPVCVCAHKGADGCLYLHTQVWMLHLYQALVMFLCSK